ncbi:MAG: ECF transporter S component [Acetobacteraceae bacterium]|nr:ECF transporter S component [Acetobacteraceae bacterium]
MTGRRVVVETVLGALLSALTLAATYFPRIPLGPLSQQYFNLGEAMIYTTALLFGPRLGAIAGAVGSALTDVLVGSIFAPFTFVIKGVEGWLVGKISTGRLGARDYLGLAAGAAWMIPTYAGTAALLAAWGRLGIGVRAAVVTEVPVDIGQCLAGAVVAVALTAALRRAVPFIRDYRGHGGAQRPAVGSGNGGTGGAAD